MIRLSEHLAGVAAVELSGSDAAAALESQLRRFGPVNSEALKEWDNAKSYLLPLKSFPTRYLVLGLGSWSVLINDMRNESCYVDALGITKKARCRAVSGYYQEAARHWRFMVPGEEDRAVLCYEDGGRWVFFEKGRPAPFERTECYSKRRKKDRLTPETVCIYLTHATGITFPLRWSVEPFKEIIGLERSSEGARVPLKLWETDDDV